MTALMKCESFPVIIRIAMSVLTGAAVFTPCFSQSSTNHFKVVSEIDLFHQGKEPLSLPFSVVDGDEFRFRMTVQKPVNVYLTNAEGETIFLKALESEEVNYFRFVKASGVMHLNVENLQPWFRNRISIDLEEKKKDLSTQQGSANGLLRDTRKLDTTTVGDLIVNSSSPQVLPYNLLLGDTIHVNIKSRRGKAPAWRLTDPSGQIRYATLPYQGTKEISIRALAAGEHLMTFESPKVRFNPFRRRRACQLEVRKVSVAKYDPIEEKVDSEPAVQGDTLLEVYLDTIVTLGAVRNPLETPERNILINIPNKGNVIKWGLAFGVKEQYDRCWKEQLTLEDSAQLDLSNDPLARYLLDSLGAISCLSNPGVAFKATPDIEEALLGKGYGQLRFFLDESRLTLRNPLQSVGQRVRVRVLVLRCSNCDG